MQRERRLAHSRCLPWQSMRELYQSDKEEGVGGCHEDHDGHETGEPYLACSLGRHVHELSNGR